MPQSASPTFQQHVLSLGGPDSEGDGRGMRFCFGREAPSHEGVFLTWPTIARRIAGLAQLLLNDGIKGSDVVLVHSHDQQTALLGMLAAIAVGAVPAAVCPVGTGTSERLVQQFLAIASVSKAVAIIADRPLPEDLTNRAMLPRILLIEQIPEQDGCPVDRTSGADEPCFLQFTSGSTSTPKGVVVTHAMLLANCAAIGALTDWSPQGRMVNWLPIYHDMSLVGQYAMAVLYQARGCCFPTSRFGRSPDLWMQLMSEERAAFSAGPNHALAMVNRHTQRRPLRDLDLSTVKGIFCGAEPVSPTTVGDFARIHAPFGFRHGIIPAYGMAECTLLATGCRPGRPIHTVVVVRRPLEHDGVVQASASGVPAGTASHGDPETMELVGCGLPQGIACMIADTANGLPLPDDRVGEIQLSGPSVLSAYHGGHPMGADVMRLHDGRSWLRTGDLGFFAGTGDGRHLYICGRAKNLIIHNGVNHYPEDIENAVLDRLGDRISLIAVVDLRAGIVDPFIGLGVLFEPTHRSKDAGEDERGVAAIVQAFSGLPTAIVLSARGDHLPRTTSGKLVRSEVTRLLRAALAQRPAP